MEDQEKRTEEEQEDVEGHGKHKIKATDEPSDETREDDDVELHGRRRTNR